MLRALHHARRLTPLSVLLTGLSLTIAAPAVAQGLPSGYPTYYIGVDSLVNVNYRQTATETAISRPNPNFGRLTFLYAHTYVATPEINHYHSIGAYTLTGPTASPTIRDTNAGNRIPEVYRRTAGLPALFLLPGTGTDAGRFVSGKDSVNEYEGLEVRSTQMLNTPGEPATDGRNVLFNSSAGRWTTSLAGAQVGIELLSITPGLNVVDAISGVSMFSGVGSVFALGTGNNVSFTPKFWVDGAAPLNTNYEATFRLVDTRTTGGFGSSGRFGFDFVTANSVAPEPGTLGLLALGATTMVPLRRRMRRRAIRR
jgi:hypothetical protein